VLRTRRDPRLSRHEQRTSGVLSTHAALAAAVSPSRLGTASPLFSAALVAAPDVRAAKGHRLRRSLRACMAEGLLAEMFGACTAGAILTAWAIYLDASTLVTGALLSLSQLAQLFQFPAAWTTSWLGHRRACIVLVGAVGCVRSAAHPRTRRAQRGRALASAARLLARRGGPAAARARRRLTHDI
jgi:hypothetical protein